MKTIAILFNLLLLVFLSILIFEEGVPDFTNFGWYEIIGTFLLFFTPIISIFVIRKEGQDWLSLYFKRKALEEKKKIDQMNNNSANK